MANASKHLLSKRKKFDSLHVVHLDVETGLRQPGTNFINFTRYLYFSKKLFYLQYVISLSFCSIKMNEVAKNSFTYPEEGHSASTF